ncbi:MAG: nitroreductase family protein [Acidobacteria bacterium]|nr:MAG: nitroreductase family protein [Acidobacteriota bacterium]
MDAIEVLKTRRCVRAYTGDAVPRETVEDIIDCAHLAASARNDQPWEFVIVTDREILTKIADLTTSGKFIANASLCVIVLCKDSQYFLEDGCNASQNILLAAHAHGLGACWVAGDKKPYADSVRKMIGAPDGYKLVSLIPIGHPAESPKKEKRPLAEVLHWGKF